MTTGPFHPYRWHLLAAALLAACAGLLFLQEPGFGDDFTYWSFGFDLHQRGLKAWQVSSFHDLRWPVWGVCWLLQAIFGIGLTAYYGPPLIYLALGAAVTFTFARMLAQPRGDAAAAAPAQNRGSVLNPLALAWAAALAFVFHPLLDSVSYRPMPDLSEAVWGGVVMLAWWTLMHASSTGKRVLFAVLTGLAIFVVESNRITGAFIVPVLLVATLWLFPKRFGWLVIAGVVAALCYAAECAFYHSLFGDWLHSLHANMGAKGRKGTGTIPLWYLPLRFLDAMWKGSVLAPFYCLFALYGGWIAWQRFGKIGRLLVIWLVVLYLEYSCAPQSIFPYHPLLRDADRFLAGLTVPFSTLAVLGLFTAGAQLAALPRVQASSAARWFFSRPLALGAIALLLLLAGTARPFFDLGFVPAMRGYMASLPAGTRVFTHGSMRDMAYLVNARAAHHLNWSAPNSILHRNDKLEADAAAASEFWYARKLVWLNTRKKLEGKALPSQPPLGSYFDTPDRDWVLTELFAKGNNPDLVFYRRRTASTPPAHIYQADAPELRGTEPQLPPLPATWQRTRDPKLLIAHWNVPAAWQGKLIRLEIDAASEQVEAVAIELDFAAEKGGRSKADFLLKPYLFPNGGKDFFVLPIPAGAGSCEVTLKFAKSAKEVAFRSFRVVLEGEALAQPK